ncbi:MAG: hypothetical protein LBS36_02685 [Oscillospiraceae bacterium]|jgi:hypothetical protein|nr:hypothetical protein [Oscillospiraceae bacterium]
MKKSIMQCIASLLIFSAVMFSLTSCGNKDDTQANASTTTETATVTEDASAGDNTSTEPLNQESSTAQNTQTTTQKPSAPSSYEEILAVYTRVMNKAKADAPGFKMKEFQKLPGTSADRKIINGSAFIINNLLTIAGGFMTTEDKAEEIKKDPGSDMKWFPVAKNSKGCLLTDVSAIKDAKYQILSDGNAEITIVLKDESQAEPTPENTNAPLSKVGSMFYPLPVKTVVETAEGVPLLKVENYDFVYHDCTAVLVFNPANDQVIKLDQTMACRAYVKGSLGMSFEAEQEIYNYTKFWDLVY